MEQSNLIDELLGLSWNGEGWATELNRLDKNTITILHTTEDDEEALTTLTTKDLKEALNYLIKNKVTIWGEKVTADPEDWDSDTADTIYQYAIFGELVFG